MSNPNTVHAIFSRTRVGRARLPRVVRVSVVTLLAVASLGACGGDSGADSPSATAAETADTADMAGARPAFGLVTPEQAAMLATDPAVTVLDVRTPDEFASGHLDGAVLVDFSSPTFADAIAELDPAQPYLVYCHSGNRSGQAVASMTQAGFESLWDLDGGVSAWTAAGLELVR